jgi:hypothetical protein
VYYIDFLEDKINMPELMRRKHQRCIADTAITYTFLNQTLQYEAIARNHNRFGLYFETRKSLVPGTLIVIRNSSSIGAGDREKDARTLPSVQELRAECPELNTQVVGEVTRCNKLEESKNPRYGIAVRYINPAA